MSDLTVLPEEFGSNKDEAPTPKQKIAQEKYEAVLTARAEERDTVCWALGCVRDPFKWVREVQFDVKGPKATAGTMNILANDFAGPVPGFCWAHDAIAAKDLAEKVYQMQEAFRWGAPALRWFVVFTDGTKIGGDINALNLGARYVVKDEHIH